VVNPLRRFFLAALLTCTVLPLQHCQEGGSELPNELTGKLVTQQNLPAARVKVGLYSVNYIPADSGSQGLSFTTQTDASGKYAFKEVPPGRYNLLGITDSLGFFRDSITVTGGGDAGIDSLAKLGSLSGVVRLQPQDDPRNAIVQVMGTDYYMNVRKDGTFTLAGLAGGFYRLRVFVGLPNYIPLFANVRVRSGEHDTLTTPLEPYFSGVPVVTAIRAEYDSSKGIAKVTWHPVDFPALMSYLVYRDPSNSVTLSGEPIHAYRITDTMFFDTLYRYDPLQKLWNGPMDQTWEYRVSVKANNSKVGETFESASLKSVTPGVPATLISVARIGGKLDEVFIGDTIRLVAQYANAVSANRTILWMTRQSDTLRAAVLGSKAGTDTLTWVAPNRPGFDSLHITVIDASGKTWTEPFVIKTVASRIIGNIANPSSDIQAFAWKGKIIYTTTKESNILICQFEIATGNDTILSRKARFVSDVDPGAALPFVSTLSGSKLYLVHANHPDFPGANLLAFDLETGNWSKEPNLSGPILAGGCIASGGKLYAIIPASTPGDSTSVEELDLTNHSWTKKKKRMFFSELFLIEHAGVIYMLNSQYGPNSNQFASYEPVSDTWKVLPFSTRFSSSMYTRLVAMNGRIYCLSGWSWFSIGARDIPVAQVDRYDAATETWSEAPDYLQWHDKPGLVALGSRIYIVGGQLWETLPNGAGSQTVPTPTIEEYYPE
jgi:hypothetical protein